MTLTKLAWARPPRQDGTLKCALELKALGSRHTAPARCDTFSCFHESLFAAVKVDLWVDVGAERGNKLQYTESSSVCPFAFKIGKEQESEMRFELPVAQNTEYGRQLT